VADAQSFDLVLDGCRVTPLAGYLKALATLRLVCEQTDPTARGFWLRDVFILRSRLDEGALIDFFLDLYAPTPVVAPWNGGSGFAAGDNQDAIRAIEASDAPRFARYRQAVEHVRHWPEMPPAFETVRELVQTLKREVGRARPGTKTDGWRKLLVLEAQTRQAAAAEMDPYLGQEMTIAMLESAAKGLGRADRHPIAAWWKVVRRLRTECVSLSRGRCKEDLLKVCRDRLPDQSLPWLDAAYAIRADDSPYYNPVLGTGGNEGRLDLSNNFMQCLVELVGSERNRDLASLLLRASLFGQPVDELPKTKIGQFDPGHAGGFNQGAEFETKDFKANPWDFVLAIEGAATLSSSVHKRMRGDSHGIPVAPFTVHFSGTGFTSNAAGERGRAEMWLPIWRRAAGYPEIQHLFREGRATVGRREARSGLDFTRAVRTLGVIRGVDEFVRYAFLERRGTSYVALPTARLPVRFDRGVRLLDDIDPILARLDGFLRSLETIPARLDAARRQVEQALFECSVDPAPEHFGALVAALGQMDQLLAIRASSGAPVPSRPLSGLRPDWVAACADGTPEVRIAAALASVRGDPAQKVGPLRSNLAGVDPARLREWAAGTGQRCWVGADLVSRLGGALARRLMDADRLNAETTPLAGWLGLSTHDLVPFLYGETDDRRIEALLWGFCLVAWHTSANRDGLSTLRQGWRRPLSRIPVPRGYALLKLVHWPGPIRDVVIRREPRVAGLLQAGRVEDALHLAGNRLRVAGLSPLPIRARDDVDPQRLMAALLVPLRGSAILEEIALTHNATTPATERRAPFAPPVPR